MRTYLKEMDWLLVAVTLAVTATGFLFIWTSSGPRLLLRQVIWFFVACSVAIVILSVHYLKMARYAYLIYAFTLVLLVLVLLSPARRGTHRWLHVGGFTVQPSEIAKLVVAITLAQFLRFRDASRFHVVAGALLLVAIPAALIVKEPDLGTAMTLFPIGMVMLFTAGMRIKHMAVIVLAAVLSVPVGLSMLKDYQKKRIIGFLYPEKTRLAEGFQTVQSVIAIGSGGFTGKGIGKGDVYVPERNTDFIFAAVGEETGFVGCSFLILLYLMMFWSALGIASRTAEPFGKLLVVGCTTSLAVHVFINTAMTLQMAPVTGLTLPMVSYGGSSLVCCYATIATILNVGMRRVHVFE